MTAWPATYRREPASKIVGCLVYAVVAPFLGLILGVIVIMPIVFGLKALGWRDEDGRRLILIPMAAVVAGVIAWGVREYRRRAGVEVVIDRDRLSIGLGRRLEVWVFSEVESIRLVQAGLDMGCILVRKGGGLIRVPPEVAPYSIVRELLEPTLIDRLRRQLGDRIRAGESIAIREHAPGGLGRIARGSGMLLGSLFLILTLRPALGVPLLRGALILMNQGWIGLGGGFVLEARGVRGRSAGRIDWDELVPAEQGEVGLILRARDGRKVAASPYAENYWPARSWLAARDPSGSAAR